MVSTILQSNETSGDSSIHRLEKGQTGQKKINKNSEITSTKGLALESRYGAARRRPPLYKRLQTSMLIVILRSNIRFKVEGYETHVTLGKKKKTNKKTIYIYIYICLCFRFLDPT